VSYQPNFRNFPRLKFLILLIFFWRKTNINNDITKYYMSWMYIYWVIQYFVKAIQNDNFYLRFGAKLQEVKMILERWQHYYFNFTQRLVGLLVKICWLQPFCCIIWTSVFFAPSLHACNSRTIKDLLVSFYILVFNKLFFWYIFKALYGFIPKTLGSPYGSKNE